MALGVQPCDLSGVDVQATARQANALNTVMPKVQEGPFFKWKIIFHKMIR